MERLFVSHFRYGLRSVAAKIIVSSSKKLALSTYGGQKTRLLLFSSSIIGENLVIEQQGGSASVVIMGRVFRMKPSLLLRLLGVGSVSLEIDGDEIEIHSAKVERSVCGDLVMVNRIFVGNSVYRWRWVLARRLEELRLGNEIVAESEQMPVDEGLIVPCIVWLYFVSLHGGEFQTL